MVQDAVFLVLCPVGSYHEGQDLVMQCDTCFIIITIANAQPVLKAQTYSNLNI